MRLGRRGRGDVAGRPIAQGPRDRRPARHSGAAHPLGRRGRGFGRFLTRARLSPPRAAALLGLLASAGALYGLALTPAFTLARTDIPELRWTTREAAASAIATPFGVNLFRLRTAPIEARLRALPGVADAHVSVSLPDTLVVEIQEREAILDWAVGDVRFLVDRTGVLFALAPADGTAAGLPAITDSRATSARLAVGSRLDPVDMDAATRLGSLVPIDLESSATSLVVAVTDANGFVVGTVPRSWIAVFGLYTPSLRTPAIIPGQVRLLRSLLAGREETIERVILADEDSGTFIPRATAVP